MEPNKKTVRLELAFVDYYNLMTFFCTVSAVDELKENRQNWLFLQRPTACLSNSGKGRGNQSFFSTWPCIQLSWNTKHIFNILTLWLIKTYYNHRTNTDSGTYSYEFIMFLIKIS